MSMHADSLTTRSTPLMSSHECVSSAQLLPPCRPLSLMSQILNIAHMHPNSLSAWATFDWCWATEVTVTAAEWRHSCLRGVSTWQQLIAAAGGVSTQPNSNSLHEERKWFAAGGNSGQGFSSYWWTIIMWAISLYCDMAYMLPIAALQWNHVISLWLLLLLLNLVLLSCYCYYYYYLLL